MPTIVIPCPKCDRHRSFVHDGTQAQLTIVEQMARGPCVRCAPTKRRRPPQPPSIEERLANLVEAVAAFLSSPDDDGVRRQLATLMMRECGGAWDGWDSQLRALVGITRDQAA